MLDILRDLWSGGVVSKVAVVLVTIVVLLIAVVLLWWLHRTYIWYATRKRCTHCNRWTVSMSVGAFSGCASGQPCCPFCHHQHKMDNEERILCPIHQTQMGKVSIDGVLIMDRCTQCGGTWLGDPKELNALKQLSYNEGFSDGQSSGQSSGVATGIVIGSIIP